MADADYSQIEYRVLTALANNEHLAELFKDPDSDYHTLMASLMYDVDYASVTPKMRSDSKSFNFGIPYGMGLGSLAILLTGVNNATTRAEAAEKYELYFKNQPKTRKFFDQVKEMALVNKYTKTFWSRYRYYSFTDADGNENNAKKAAALRQAGNAIIQGCERGDSLIQTKEYGIVEIQDVVDKHLHVWDGEKWSEGDILYSGQKRKCIVTFGNNQQFVCSPDHKFLVRSSKGNERFVRCEDLRPSSDSTNPHRVVINKEFEDSDWVYSSNWARLNYLSMSPSAKNVFLDDIDGSFKIGVVLGRLASDGNIGDYEHTKLIRQIVAEHEYDVGDVLIDYMKPLGVTINDMGLREGRTEKIKQIKVHSTSLVGEVKDLDIKRRIPKKVFQDTEMLRGFIRGLFDGDGGVSGKTIALTFGVQDDFEPFCRDIQKALMFFGIRSRYSYYPGDRHKITISTYDNQKFVDEIGFISNSKQEKASKLHTVRENKMFSGCLTVQSVEVTDEYIDMYDVCNTDGGYYVSDGIITHNTAADIFKISVARNFMYIRENNLLGDLLIINMVHDEQLFEINAQKLNVQRVLRDIGQNMQFKVEGFPPLYIGAGIGAAWAKAKGKMAEIHPLLLEQLSREADNIPIHRTETTPVTEKEILDYFDSRVLDFRRNKVKEYLSNPENFGKELHPAIGNLLNLQFTYGHDKDKEGLTDSEFTLICVDEFIKHEGIPGVEASYFTAQVEQSQDIDEDDGYDDSDDEFDEDEFEYSESSFALVDDSNTYYGATLHDLIRIFGCFVSPAKRICGINLNILNYKKKENLIEFLSEHACDEDAPGAMEIVFLQEANILNRTGIYVNNIEGSEVEARIAEMHAS